MQEIIKIEKSVIGTEEVNSVNARDLWKQLEVKTEFSKWIKRRLEECMATENEDYLRISKKVEATTLFTSSSSRILPI